MALRPKLEFFRFKLAPQEGEYKTFRDFAIEELYLRRPSNDAQIMNKLYEHFMNNLSTDIAKVKQLKKQLKLIRNNANKYLNYRPNVNVNRYIIHGVINAGRFGRDGMMSDSSSSVNEGETISKNKTILHYYYFLLYLPLDHNEGCFIVHSNSKEETMTDVFKVYVSKLFRRGNYKYPTISMFCPQSFRREFQEQAIVKSFEFQRTCTDGIFTDDGIMTNNQTYDVKIEIMPRDGGVLLRDRNILNGLLRQLGLRRTPNNIVGLTDFESRKVILSDPISKSDRTFDLNDEELNVIPVVYLKNRINHYNDDDTPNFLELNTLCQNLLQDEVLPEIRPDLYENEH